MPSPPLFKISLIHPSSPAALPFCAFDKAFSTSCISISPSNSPSILSPFSLSHRSTSCSLLRNSCRSKFFSSISNLPNFLNASFHTSFLFSPLSTLSPTCTSCGSFSSFFLIPAKFFKYLQYFFSSLSPKFSSFWLSFLLCPYNFLHFLSPFFVFFHRFLSLLSPSPPHLSSQSVLSQRFEYV